MEKGEDVLLFKKTDRRILAHVPDPTTVRASRDRRGNVVNFYDNTRGERYLSNFDVTITSCTRGGRKHKFDKPESTLKSADISSTGILLACPDEEQAARLKESDHVKLKFTITPGSMPEGYETRVKTKAKVVRTRLNEEGGYVECGLQFEKNLAEIIHKSRGRYLFLVSIAMLFVVALFIALMRTESLLFFSFNRVLYLYSIVAAVFLLSRYFFGALYRPVPVDPGFTPGVSIIIPCFEEEEWIAHTIRSCIDQDYPTDKLEVIVVDDCSADRSVERIKEIVDTIKQDRVYGSDGRLSYHAMTVNGGKREALSLGVLQAKHELVVFVDSDSFLDPQAIRSLVQPFRDPKMGGVAGRTDVANIYTNWVTKMQAARYFIAFRVMKGAESYFDTVTCLSGPLACYRKDIVLDNLDRWREQKFLGQPATFGDDRAMTNNILRKYRTAYQDTALCSTIVPNKQKVFLKQQMRWKRSWLRETIVAGKFIWKKEPFAALFFYMSFIIPVLAPVIVLFNFLVVPLTQGVFPFTFIFGLLMMSMMMSFAYLFFKRSRVWIYSALFCVYYVGVLLWQMPYAWVTYWKTTWGTRMTPADIEAAKQKEDKRSLSNVK